MSLMDEVFIDSFAKEEMSSAPAIHFVRVSSAVECNFIWMVASGTNIQKEKAVDFILCSSLAVCTLYSQNEGLQL